MNKWAVLFFFLCLFTSVAMVGYAAQEHHEQRGPDGKYHNPATGEAQPDQCRMTGDHPCHCARTDPNNCQTDGNESRKWEPGGQCQTWCREGDCLCRTSCGE